MSNFVTSGSSLPGTKVGNGNPSLPANAQLTGPEANTITSAIGDVRSYLLQEWDLIAYGADPTGAADCSAAFTAALAAIGSAPAVLRLRAGTFLLTGNTTSLPKNVVLRVLDGKLTFGNAGQITITGDVEAGEQQVFSASSLNTTPVLFTGPIRRVSPVWFGADPTGVADSSTAFTQAVNSLPAFSPSGSLAAAQALVEVPPGGKFNLTTLGAIPIGVRPRKIFLPSASAPPAAGLWQVGDTVDLTDATPGGGIGYVCTTAGSPGTWKLYGDVST